MQRLFSSLTKRSFILPKRHFGGGVFDPAEKMTSHARTQTMYYSDPEAVAIKVCALIALHENIAVEGIKLSHTWRELGLSELDKIEVMLQLEDEFDISIPEDATERFKNVYDLVQWLSKSVFVH